MANPPQTLDLPKVERRAGGPRWRLSPLRLVLYTVLVVGAVMSLVPFYWMFATSFMTLGETLNREWWPESLQVVNYVTAWEEAKFGSYFLNSVIITGVTIVGLLLTSIPAGYAFARIRFPGRELLFAAVLATLMIPESVTIIPSYLVVRGDVFPLPGGSWLNSLQALTVPFWADAFAIFLLRQFFTQVPIELWEAARIDGAGHTRFLVQIVLPLSRAPIVTVLIFTFIGAWNAFAWPLIVTTRETWRPLMVGLWRFVGEAGPETNLMMAGAVITIVPMLILYFFTQKQFTEGIATTGLKG